MRSWVDAEHCQLPDLILQIFVVYDIMHLSSRYTTSTSDKIDFAYHRSSLLRWDSSGRCFISSSDRFCKYTDDEITHGSIFEMKAIQSQVVECFSNGTTKILHYPILPKRQSLIQYLRSQTRT